MDIENNDDINQIVKDDELENACGGKGGFIESRCKTICLKCGCSYNLYYVKRCPVCYPKN